MDFIASEDFPILPECSYLTAGTALIGAGAIAFSPINPAATAVRDLHVPAVVSGLGVALAAAPNPIQTWVDFATQALSNTRFWVAAVGAVPAPIVQQVLANLINYAGIDIGGYQAAAAGAVTYFGATAFGSFQYTLQQAVTALQQGKIGGGTGAASALYNAMFYYPIADVLEPMEAALMIPVDISANLAAAAGYLLGTSTSPFDFIPNLGEVALLNIASPMAAAIGTDLQAAYDAAVTGDGLGTIASLIDIPGSVAYAFLNGTGNTGGLLGPTNSIANVLLAALPQNVAPAIVSPGAQNIMAGGNLITALQDFVTEVTTGWPTPTELATIPAGIQAGFNGLPQAIAGVIGQALQGLFSGLVPGGAAALTPTSAASGPSSAARSLTLSVSQPATVSTDSGASSEGAELGSSGASATEDVSGQALAGHVSTDPGSTTPRSSDSAISARNSVADSSPANRGQAVSRAAASSGSPSGPLSRGSVSHNLAGSARHAHRARSGSRN